MQEVEYSCAHFAQTKSGVTIFFPCANSGQNVAKKEGDSGASQGNDRKFPIQIIRFGGSRIYGKRGGVRRK